MEIVIENGTRILYKNILVFVESFAKVSRGRGPGVYQQSGQYPPVAINQGSFARAYSIGTGTNWSYRPGRRGLSMSKAGARERRSAMEKKPVITFENFPFSISARRSRHCMTSIPDDL